MVKKLVIILISCCLLVFSSCIIFFQKKNDKGVFRYSKTFIKPYKNNISLPDSINYKSGYYQLLKNSTVYNSNSCNFNIRKYARIFYNDGKLGEFFDYDEGFDFDPKSAEMGYYGKKNDSIYIKTILKVPYTKLVEEESVIKLIKDTLITYHTNSATGGGFYSTYVKVYRNDLKGDVDW